MSKSHLQPSSNRFFLKKLRQKRGLRRGQNHKPGLSGLVSLKKRSGIGQPRVNFEKWRQTAKESAAIASHPLSRILRRVFESSRIRPLVGINLTIAALTVSFLRTPTLMAASLAIPILPSNSIQIDLATKQSVIKPLPQYVINQGFSIFHPGIDLGAKVGDPIHPIMDGVVTESGWSLFGYGNTILIDHLNSYESRYAHLSVIFAKNGDHVTRSMVIGLVGTSGHSTGPHLHLEVHQNGIPFDPRNILE